MLFSSSVITHTQIALLTTCIIQLLNNMVIKLGGIMQPRFNSKCEQTCHNIIHIGFAIMMIAATICAVAIVYAVIAGGKLS